MPRVIVGYQDAIVALNKRRDELEKNAKIGIAGLVLCPVCLTESSCLFQASVTTQVDLVGMQFVELLRKMTTSPLNM